MSITQEVAVRRARFVAASDADRAFSILRRARIKRDSAIAIVARFVGAASFVALTACGGGNADDAQTAAEAASRSGTQPMACAGVTGLNCQ